MTQKTYLLETKAYLNNEIVKNGTFPAMVDTNADAIRCVTALAEEDLKIYEKVDCKVTHNGEIIGEFTFNKS